VLFTLKMEYWGHFGASAEPDTGSIHVGATAVPDATGDMNKRGGAAGEIFWAYLSPLIILTETLPVAYLGVPYSETLAVKGGHPPYIWGLTAITGSPGILPPNLSLDEKTGQITGVPIQTGVFVFQVRVLDTKSQVATADLSITVTTVPIVIPSPPPPPSIPLPPGPPGGSPPPPVISPPGTPVFMVEDTPGIEVLFQPLLPDKCDGTVAGLGPILINNFIIPRPDTGSNAPVTEGPWKNFQNTWYGFWTADQLSQIMVEVKMNLVDPASPGSQNNLYISALDVIVTRALGPTMTPWLVNQKPEGRIKWMSARDPEETGPNSGKWFDGDVMPYRPVDDEAAFMASIIGTAHKGGLDQNAADGVLGRYEIFGWLDRDGDGEASAGDDPPTQSMAWLDTNIGVLDDTILVKNIGALRDPLNKYFQGFLIDNELIVVQRDQVDFKTGLLSNVWRAVNETVEAFHSKGTVVFPVSYWEMVYQVKVADAVTGDFQGSAVGWNTPPATDDGTPGELLQKGPLDLRPFSGDYPIRWLLRLRAIDIYGFTTECAMDQPGAPDRFFSTGPGARFGPDGNADVPSKRVLYVLQSRDPKRPKIISSQ
jgi:hypothetical protein